MKVLVFVANKYDRLKTDAADKRMQSYRSIISKHFGEAFGPISESGCVLPCVLVQSAYGTTKADAVISRIAKALAA